MSVKSERVLNVFGLRMNNFILIVIALSVGFLIGYNLNRQECTLEPSEYYYHCLHYESGKCLKIILRKYTEREVLR